jgi:FKBP-type peptidyl-prolyl cis-trans isomerase 2
MSVVKGNYVKVEYHGTLDDGTVFDSTEKHGDPLGFTVGAGQMIPGFDAAVEGMALNEEKQIHLEAKDAYGEHNAEMIKKVDRKQMPEGELQEGMQLGLQTPDGYMLPVWITKVEDDHVMLDFNHPLAGKPLNFKLKVVEILEKAPPEAEHHGCGCGCSGSCDDGCDSPGCDDHHH